MGARELPRWVSRKLGRVTNLWTCLHVSGVNVWEVTEIMGRCIRCLVRGGFFGSRDRISDHGARLPPAG